MVTGGIRLPSADSDYFDCCMSALYSHGDGKMGWRLRTLRREGPHGVGRVSALLSGKQHAPALSRLRDTAFEQALQAVSRVLVCRAPAATDVHRLRNTAPTWSPKRHEALLGLP